MADSRKAKKWMNHWESIEDNGYLSAYLVCDEGKGLATAQKKTLSNTFRQLDTYAHRNINGGKTRKRLD